MTIGKKEGCPMGKEIKICKFKCWRIGCQDYGSCWLLLVFLVRGWYPGDISSGTMLDITLIEMHVNVTPAGYDCYNLTTR